MNDYVIHTDSSIDLPRETVKELELKVTSLTVIIEGQEFFNDDSPRGIGDKEFYAELREKKHTSTSQVNAPRFIEDWEPALIQGKDILYIGFSSGLSGTYNSSVQAKNELIEKYPDRKIITIDSLAASMGQGLLVTYAARLKKSGKSIDEVANWVLENRLNLCHIFTVGDLNHLKRGGRLSSTKAILGTLLSVKPILHVSTEGKLVQISQTRGRKKSLIKMVELVEETIVNPSGQEIYISHGDCEEDALFVKQLIMKKLPIKDVLLNYVGPVIGSHSGIGTLAIFYLGNERKE